MPTSGPRGDELAEAPGRALAFPTPSTSPQPLAERPAQTRRADALIADCRTALAT
ncbi:MAG: hypothetical protein R3B49_02770 [Phycisphaerales bacterium]